MSDFTLTTDTVEEFDFPNDFHSVPYIEDNQSYLDEEKKVFDSRLTKKTSYNVELKDFDLFAILGAGSFGKVVLAQHKESGNFYAIKLLEKRNIVRGKQVQHSLNERRILEALKFPFTVYLECFFHDNSYLYFTMPLIVGGDVFTNLNKFGRFDETLAKFYGAQVILGLEYLHYMDLVYRDLKPENLLIDSKGYIKISDFGFCKKVKGRTWTLCGTPEYLAPEIIMSKAYGKFVDWWSFGVLVYEFCAGQTPFYAKDHMKLYEKIIAGVYKTASHFSQDLIDLLEKLLQIDISKRLGNLKEGTNELKTHKWFSVIEWLDLLNYKIDAPYIPQIKGSSDISNFDTRRDDELVIRINKHNIYAKDFTDF